MCHLLVTFDFNQVLKVLKFLTGYVMPQSSNYVVYVRNFYLTMLLLHFKSKEDISSLQEMA